MDGITIIVVDEWDRTRHLRDAGDGTYEGEITVAGEAMAYWLPRAVVESWLARGSLLAPGDSRSASRPPGAVDGRTAEPAAEDDADEFDAVDDDNLPELDDSGEELDEPQGASW